MPTFVTENPEIMNMEFMSNKNSYSKGSKQSTSYFYSDFLSGLPKEEIASPDMENSGKILHSNISTPHASRATPSTIWDETDSVLASPDCISFWFSPPIKSKSSFDCFGTTKPIALSSSFEATLGFDESNKPIELATEDPSSHATPLISIPLTRASKFGCSLDDRWDLADNIGFVVLPPAPDMSTAITHASDNFTTSMHARANMAATSQPMDIPASVPLAMSSVQSTPHGDSIVPYALTAVSSGPAGPLCVDPFPEARPSVKSSYSMSHAVDNEINSWTKILSRTERKYLRTQSRQGSLAAPPPSLDGPRSSPPVLNRPPASLPALDKPPALPPAVDGLPALPPVLDGLPALPPVLDGLPA